MHDLPTDWSALCALVFLLGMRHGFDADHLATINGLTRLGSQSRSPFARYGGVLFSLGHVRGRDRAELCPGATHGP